MPGEPRMTEDDGVVAKMGNVERYFLDMVLDNHGGLYEMGQGSGVGRASIESFEDTGALKGEEFQSALPGEGFVDKSGR